MIQVGAEIIEKNNFISLLLFHDYCGICFIVFGELDLTAIFRLAFDTGSCTHSCACKPAIHFLTPMLTVLKASSGCLFLCERFIQGVLVIDSEKITPRKGVQGTGKEAFG